MVCVDSVVSVVFGCSTLGSKSEAMQYLLSGLRCLKGLFDKLSLLSVLGAIQSVDTVVEFGSQFRTILKQTSILTYSTNFSEFSTLVCDNV